jgi:hypothetical protein
LAARPLFPPKVTLATWLEVGFSFICLKPTNCQLLKAPVFQTADSALQEQKPSLKAATQPQPKPVLIKAERI